MIQGSVVWWLTLLSGLSTGDRPAHPRASVSLSPSRLTLDVGEVHQFVARSSSGSAVRYRASAGKITPAGVFTAPQRTGLITVIASDIRGTADTAIVRVVEPEDPYVLEDFDSCSLKHGGNRWGFRWTDSQGGPGEQPEISDRIARSGTCSLKFSFRGGQPGDDAWSEQRFSLGKKLTEIYLQWYQYFPSGLEQPSVGPRFAHRDDRGPDNNKLLRLWDEDYNQYRLKVGFSMLPTSSGNSQIIAEHGTNRRGVGPKGARSDPAGITDARRGRWIRIQVHARVASPANNDGVLEMWIDGMKAISNTNLPLYPTGGEGNYFRHGYLMGWANSGFDQNSITYIDDLVISVSPIR